jgi:DNA-binding LytR/AlgR family response regulator
VISRSATERVEAEGDYMRIFGDVESLVRITLRELDRRLGPAFVRVSRSTLVNVAHVREVRRLGGERWEALMASGERVPVTAAYRDALDSALRTAPQPQPNP